jgi:hypothetical protein
MVDLDLNARADLYRRAQGVDFTDRLGGGTDGEVWKSNRQTAVKVFRSPKNYHMELACYQRLKERGIRKVRDFAVPRLIQSDDKLLVIEMEIVTAPYLIDFGKAYLDREPDHSAETWAEHHAAQRELWEDKYNEVQAVLWSLRQIGIYYRDPKPGNIMFASDAE